MNKIILISMIKNEEIIIERCLDSILNLVDGICITDTGSTDNTVSIINEYSKKINIPLKLYQDEWKNFGHNRSNSFLNALEFCKELNWDLNKTYGILLDADMKLVIGKFDKNELNMIGYNIIQSNSNLDYYNTRLIRMDYNWKCIGVTHEYWNGENKKSLNKDVIYINDVGDGGCKSDKISRDIRLLEQGIKDEPNNCRYYFYLAQSYKDNREFKKAIENYKINIKIGNWCEEIWYSHYMISKCYLYLKNEIKFEQWALKAYNYRKIRSEPIYELVKYFREKSQHYKAYYYYLIGKNIHYPKDDILFIEKNTYNYKFDWEYTILHYYIFPKERVGGLKIVINYYNNNDYNCNLAFDNIIHYMNRIIDDGSYYPLDIMYDTESEFNPSSVSLLEIGNKILANIRLVNYKIDPEGRYIYKNKVTTKNAFMFLNYKLEPISNVELMNETLSDLTNKNTHILGLEDVRLYSYNNKILYTAVSMEYSYNDKIRIINGEYNYDKKEFINNVCMIPPTETNCEKNWVSIDDKFIYKWYPLQIGILNDNKLEITYTCDTPKFFNKYRGSTNALKYNNQYWFVTHGIMNCVPRKYFHQITILDENYKLINYTIPFYFNKKAIEYCLGFIIIADTAYFTCSRNDCNPIIVKITLTNLQKYFM
jgi:glycosyltransferase involved in cell wall biosynthesis